MVALRGGQGGNPGVVGRVAEGQTTRLPGQTVWTFCTGQAASRAREGDTEAQGGSGRLAPSHGLSCSLSKEETGALGGKGVMLVWRSLGLGEAGLESPGPRPSPTNPILGPSSVFPTWNWNHPSLAPADTDQSGKWRGPEVKVRPATLPSHSEGPVPGVPSLACRSVGGAKGQGPLLKQTQTHTSHTQTHPVHASMVTNAQRCTQIVHTDTHRRVHSHETLMSTDGPMLLCPFIQPLVYVHPAGHTQGWLYTQGK